MPKIAPNVVAFTTRTARSQPQVEPLTVAIPMDRLDRLPAYMTQLAVTAELASRILDKRSVHGDDAVIEGLKQVFGALARMVV